MNARSQVFEFVGPLNLEFSMHSLQYEQALVLCGKSLVFPVYTLIATI